MGDFHVDVLATGGHGCQREVKDGGTVFGCQQMGCPDCIVREFIETLKRKGCSVKVAKLTHWPGERGQVQDDLLTLKRTGSF